MLTALLCTATVAALSFVAALPEIMEARDNHDTAWTVGGSFSSGHGHVINARGQKEIDLAEDRRRALAIEQGRNATRVLDTPDTADRREVKIKRTTKGGIETFSYMALR